MYTFSSASSDLSALGTMGKNWTHNISQLYHHIFKTFQNIVLISEMWLNCPTSLPLNGVLPFEVFTGRNFARQAMIFRPRLVLTNSSNVTLQLQPLGTSMFLVLSCFVHVDATSVCPKNEGFTQKTICIGPSGCHARGCNLGRWKTSRLRSPWPGRLCKS